MILKMIFSSFPLYLDKIFNSKSVKVMYLSSLILFILLKTSGANEMKLVNYLLKNHSLFARPVLDSNKTVHVKIGFELIHIVSINEGDQTVAIKLWMRMSWMNEYLRWNPSRFEYVYTTRLNREKVWTPDIYAQEDISEDLSVGSDKYKTLIKLNYTGENTWLIPVLLKGSCKIHVERFPFDRQMCFYTFTSWTHDQKEIDLKEDPRPMVTSNFINSSEWTLLRVEKKLESNKFECCPNPISSMKFTMYLDRKPKYYVFNVIVPCIIQMLIVLFTFFLPPDCGERIGVVVTVLLVFAVYLEMVSGSLPKTSTSTPTLSQFYIISMAETVCAFFATSFVLAVHFKGAEKGVGPMPNWIRILFLEKIAKYTGIKQNLREHTNESLLAVSRKSTINNDVDGKVYSSPKPNGGLHQQRAIKCNGELKTSNDMDTLINEVRVITTLINDLNNQDEIEEEWQILTKVFDRLFFILFLLIFFFSSVIILLPVYFGL